MLSQDKITEARSALAELDDLAKNYDTIFLQAVTAYCEGAVLLKEMDPSAAIKTLRRSMNLWTMLDAPYETAVVRLLLGIAYKDKEDHDSARLELKAAQWIFKEF